MRIALATCSNLPNWEIDDRPLHTALRDRGCEPVPAVWDDPSIVWSDFDAVLIRTTWDYMEKRDAFVEWARRVESQTRLFHPARIVEWNTRKFYLRDLAEHRIPVAPTVWLEHQRSCDIAELMRDQRWPRGFIKPVIGATARETLRFDNDRPGLAAAQQHLDRMLAREDMMVQPYLARVETEGERSAIFIDGRFSHAVQKVPVHGDYRVQDDFDAKDFPIALSDDQRAAAQRVITVACDVIRADLLYARCDFLTDDAGAWVLTELEVVEPSMFFRHDVNAAGRLAEALLARLHCDEASRGPVGT